MFKIWRRKRLLNKVYSFAKQKHITLPKNPYGHVFVFGSNLKGWHDGGAARFALMNYGAKDGVAQGPTGNAYAIPTLDANLNQLDLLHLGGFVFEFKKEAETNPNVTYHLTPIGLGIAGYDVRDIAPMFLTMPKNVILPIEFQEFFLKDWYWYADFFKDEAKNAKNK